MATVSAPPGQQEVELNGTPPRATTLDWGNSAPLALLAFAVTTFMLSMVNANAISAGVQPVVFGVALMFGGLTQLIWHHPAADWEHLFGCAVLGLRRLLA